MQTRCAPVLDPTMNSTCKNLWCLLLFKVIEKPGTAADNFAILFSGENNGDFAKRKLPSIADHNEKNENHDEGKFFLMQFIYWN